MREVLVAEGTDGLEAAVAAARAAGVPVRRAPDDVLDDHSGGVRHQGIVARAAPYRYAALQDLLVGELVVVLDGITDPRNLGAIARSAHVAGATGLVVRERRGAGVTPSAEKAAAGALSWLPVARVPNVVRALDQLAAAGLWRVGLDDAARDDLWSSPLLDERVALVVGAEGAGMSRLVREHLDAVVRIPVRGEVGPLNAAAALTVAVFEVVRRRNARWTHGDVVRTPDGDAGPVVRCPESFKD